jgi:hypothetical protein
MPRRPCCTNVIYDQNNNTVNVKVEIFVNVENVAKRAAGAVVRVTAISRYPTESSSSKQTATLPHLPEAIMA